MSKNHTMKKAKHRKVKTLKSHNGEKPHHDNIMTPRHHDIAMSGHQSAAILRSQNGELGNGRDESRVDVIKSTPTQGGTSPSYILRRLARDGAEDASKAELFKQVTKGTISAHKAALEAGYRTKKTPLETVKTIIARLETEDVKAVLEYLKEQLKTRR